MNKEFIPYEQALELKKLGFDETCLAWHNSGRLFIDNYNAINSKMDFDYCCALPLYQQAFRWFREKYELCGIPSPLGYEILDKGHPTAYWGCIKEEILESYEEAELACLKQLIEIVDRKAEAYS